MQVSAIEKATGAAKQQLLDALFPELSQSWPAHLPLLAARLDHCVAVADKAVKAAKAAKSSSNSSVVGEDVQVCLTLCS